MKQVRLLSAPRAFKQAESFRRTEATPRRCLGEQLCPPPSGASLCRQSRGSLGECAWGNDRHSQARTAAPQREWARCHCPPDADAGTGRQGGEVDPDQTRRPQLGQGLRSLGCRPSAFITQKMEEYVSPTGPQEKPLCGRSKMLETYPFLRCSLHKPREGGNLAPPTQPGSWAQYLPLPVRTPSGARKSPSGPHSTGRCWRDPRLPVRLVSPGFGGWGWPAATSGSDLLSSGRRASLGLPSPPGIERQSPS